MELVMIGTEIGFLKQRVSGTIMIISNNSSNNKNSMLLCKTITWDITCSFTLYTSHNTLGTHNYIYAINQSNKYHMEK